jgi:two-component system invasion response regulator UvrY
MKLRFLIADDHSIVRSGLRQILLDEFSSAEIIEVQDTDSLIQSGSREYWDIIISDISMPGAGGAVAIGQILMKQPRQRILILSIYPEEQYALQMIRYGAYGFLNKDSAPEKLVEAVKIILNGYHYISPALTDRPEKKYHKPDPASDEDKEQNKKTAKKKMMAGVSQT